MRHAGLLRSAILHNHEAQDVLLIEVNSAPVRLSVDVCGYSAQPYSLIC
jgi:hypothetical protein